MNRHEAIGESLVEPPQGLVIIPAIVKQERIQLHAALLHQFLAVGVNHTQGGFLVILTEIAYVIPRIVMEEWTIGMSALPLQISQKTAPQLPLENKTDDRRARETLPDLQRRAAGQEAAHIAHLAAIDRERVLDSKERRLSRNG